MADAYFTLKYTWVPAHEYLWARIPSYLEDLEGKYRNIAGALFLQHAYHTNSLISGKNEDLWSTSLQAFQALKDRCDKEGHTEYQALCLGYIARAQIALKEDPRSALTEALYYLEERMPGTFTHKILATAIVQNEWARYSFLQQKWEAANAHLQLAIAARIEHLKWLIKIDLIRPVSKRQAAQNIYWMAEKMAGFYQAPDDAITIQLTTEEEAILQTGLSIQLE